MDKTIHEFLILEDRIKKATVEMKQMQESKKSLAEALEHYMKQNNIDIVKYSDRAISLKMKKQYSSLNKEYLEHSLSSFVKESIPKEPQQFAEKATEHLLANRDCTEKNYLSIKTLK